MTPLARLSWPLAALGQLLIVAAGTATPTEQSFRERCLSFTPEKFIWNSTRTRLEFVPGGTALVLDDNVESCNRPQQAVDADICRVALQIPTSARSSISFELWLPEEWADGRYLATGNGGIDGCSLVPPFLCLEKRGTRCIG